MIMFSGVPLELELEEPVLVSEEPKEYDAKQVRIFSWGYLNNGLIEAIWGSFFYGASLFSNKWGLLLVAAWLRYHNLGWFIEVVKC